MDNIPDQQPERKDPSYSGIDDFLEQAKAAGVVIKENVDTLVRNSSSQNAEYLINNNRFKYLKSLIVGNANGRPSINNLNARVARKIVQQDPNLVWDYLDRFVNLDANFASQFIVPRTLFKNLKNSILMTGKELKDDLLVKNLTEGISSFNETDHQKIVSTLIDRGYSAEVEEELSRFRKLNRSTVDDIFSSNPAKRRYLVAKNILDNLQSFDGALGYNGAISALIENKFDKLVVDRLKTRVIKDRLKNLNQEVFEQLRSKGYDEVLMDNFDAFELDVQNYMIIRYGKEKVMINALVRILEALEQKIVTLSRRLDNEAPEGLDPSIADSLIKVGHVEIVINNMYAFSYLSRWAQDEIISFQKSV